MAEELLSYRTAFESFEKKSGVKSPPWIHPLRRTALSKFTEIGFPTPREEDWKYTNLSPYIKTPFRFSFEPFLDGLNREKVEPLVLAKTKGPVLVFVNGFYSKELSRVSGLPQGVKVGSLASALQEHSKLVERHLGKIAPHEKNGLTALNTAFIQDGAFVYLPEGKSLEEPIYLLFIALPSEERLIFQPRNLIILDRASQATFVENYVSLSKNFYFTNAVTEITLNEGAAGRHYKIQREGKTNACHVATTQVHLGRHSRFSSFSISLGAKCARENLNVLLDAEETECTLNGLYLVSEGRHVDHHTLIDHRKPHGRSRQLYKGIIEGKSTAVFNGKVFVHKNARKTDAEQTNKNLLLSEEATVDAKPQLEIYNDDVKCTHGAAVGQLDEEQVFYLKSRGMNEEEARSLLTYGFASEVLHRVENEAIRSALDPLLWDWLQKNQSLEMTV